MVSQGAGSTSSEAASGSGKTTEQESRILDSRFCQQESNLYSLITGSLVNHLIIINMSYKTEIFLYSLIQRILDRMKCMVEREHTGGVSRN